MKRHVAATLLGVIGLLTLDNHIDWLQQDNGIVLGINGKQYDPKGWLSEQWRAWRQDCRPVISPDLQSPTAQAVLRTIQQHSLPDSREAQLLQLHQLAEWSIAEASFPSLNPSLVVLRQHHGQWQIQDSAIWSGSTAPWHAAHFVRQYLHKQSPDLPLALLQCVPINPARYAALTTVSAP